jgi:hypothetical protein
MVSAVAILAIGATMGLAVAHWPAGPKSANLDLTSLPKDPIAGVPDLSISSVQRSAPATASASPVARAQESCEAGLINALAEVFLDSTCGSNKVHARHGARATNRVATVIIGRTDAPPVSAAAVAVTATEPSASGAEKSIASTIPTVERRAPRPKKVVTSGGSAYASVPRSERDSSESYRFVAPQYRFDGRFGRPW